MTPCHVMTTYRFTLVGWFIEMALGLESTFDHCTLMTCTHRMLKTKHIYISKHHIGPIDVPVCCAKCNPLLFTALRDNVCRLSPLWPYGCAQRFCVLLDTSSNISPVKQPASDHAQKAIWPHLKHLQKWVRSGGPSPWHIPHLTKWAFCANGACPEHFQCRCNICPTNALSYQRLQWL